MTRWASIVLLALSAACGSEKHAAPAAGESTAAVVAPVNPTIAAAPRATLDAKGCLHDGRWRPCALVDRLERSGLAVQLEPDSAHYDFLGVPGLKYLVGGKFPVEAFFYDDTTRLVRDVAALDTAAVAPRGTTHDWTVKPTFVQSGNLVVLLMTLNEHAIERLSLAVEGGAPQPDPDAAALRPTVQPLPPAKAP